MSRKDHDRLTIDSPEDLVREVNREIDAMKAKMNKHSYNGHHLRETFNEMMQRTAPKIPTVAEAVDAKKWRKVESAILDDIDAEVADQEEASRQMRKFVDDVAKLRTLGIDVKTSVSGLPDPPEPSEFAKECEKSETFDEMIERNWGTLSKPDECVACGHMIRTHKYAFQRGGDWCCEDCYTPGLFKDPEGAQPVDKTGDPVGLVMKPNFYGGEMAEVSIGGFQLNPEHFASEEGIEYNHPQADPDVMGYLHSAFGVAPALAGQNYRITLGALDLDFCLNESTDEWSVYIDAITVDDFVYGIRTLALAVQAAKESARKILTEDLERLQ